MSRALLVLFQLVLHAAVWLAVLTEHPVPTRIVYAAAVLSVLLPPINLVLFAVAAALDNPVSLPRRPQWLRLMGGTLDTVEVLLLVGFGWWWCAAAYGGGAVLGSAARDSMTKKEDAQ